MQCFLHQIGIYNLQLVVIVVCYHAYCWIHLSRDHNGTLWPFSWRMQHLGVKALTHRLYTRLSLEDIHILPADFKI